LVVCRGSLDRVIGIVRKQDILDLCLDGNGLGLCDAIHSGAFIPETETVLRTFELFARDSAHAALVVGRNRILSGIVTRTDILRTIAGG
jgi:putative hemolysin